MNVLALSSSVLALAFAVFGVSTERGLTFLHQNSPTPQKYLIETMGGGVAILDYNNDRLPDIFFVNGGKLTDSMKRPERFDRSNPRYWNRLYRQNPDRTFSDVTAAAGLSTAGEENYGMGVAAADYDNDGYTDLYVTSYGKNVLYHNNGNGTFSDVTSKSGVSTGGWSTSAGFLDYDNDGHLDLFVARYMEWDTARSKACGGTWRIYCLPGEFPATTNVLFHNRGDGTFEDVSRHSGVSAKKARSLGVAFNDYDADGWTDMFVANDGMEQFLIHNNRDGTFTEKALDSGVALSDDGKPYAGMGVDFRDYDNDGRPDLIVTNLARQIYAVYHNDGNGQFSYRSLETGVGTLSAGSSGWGVRWEDFDNNGWKDLFVAQSHVMDNVEQIDPSLHYREPPLLALNHEGRFERADTGAASPVAGRGAAFGDLNNDGCMDVVTSNLGDRPSVFLNQGSREHWLTIKLQGTRSNRDGFGARVEVNGQWQFAGSAGSYLSASDKRVHFGLANATQANINVFWPSGTRQTLHSVSVDKFMDIREPEQP